MSLATEVGALRASAGLSAATHVALVQVSGPDAFELLQQTSTRAPYLREGRVLHTLMLQDDGSIFADSYIALVDDGYLVLAEGPSEAEVVSWIEELKHRDSRSLSADVSGQSADWVLIALDGPYAWEVAAGLLGQGVLGMPYLSLLRRDDVLCVRAGKTGEYGYLLLAPLQAAGALEAKLVEIGRPIDLAEVQLAALDVCALENGHFSIRHLGKRPFAVALTPIELQLQWRVVYERQFVGAEALRAHRAEGARVRATSFLADEPIEAGQPVRLGDREAGTVLAACFSPTLGRWVGSALLDVRFAHPHLRMSAETDTGVVAVETTTAPLVRNISLEIDPHKHSYMTRGVVHPAPEAAR